MASFNGNIPTPSNGFNAKVDYSYTQDVASNKSTITSITGYVKRNNSSYYPYNSTKSATIKIEYLNDSGSWITAKTLSDTSSYNLNTNSYVKFVSGSNIAIPHKSDGTQSLRITFTVDGKLSNYYPKGSVSNTSALTTIARASQPTLSASSVNMGSSVTINTNRASDSFTHTISYSFGSASGTIASNVGASTTWTPPLSLANQIPNNTSGTCVITCKTYSGSTLIGTKTVNLTLTVPSSVVPSISSVSVSEANQTMKNTGWGVYVKNKSQLKVVTSASGSYGSTITSYKITGIDSSTYTSNNFTSNVLTTSGTRTITATVTDSRGRTATKTTTYTCVDYSNPSISTASVVRCNADGTENSEGTNVKYSFKANVAPVSNHNSHVFKIGYKKTTDSSYTYVTIANDGYSLDKSNVVLSGITFSVDNSYDFQFYVEDYFTSSAITRNIPTGFTLMDFHSSGKGMAIGKVSEKADELEMAMQIISKESFNQGGWNSPTKGMITQVTNNSGSQHSPVVGLKSDGKTRLYGIDFLDKDSDPQMRLYAGSKYMSLSSTAMDTNGLLTSTYNGNTVSIGSRNTSYCHIYNSADIPFYFNKEILINGSYVLKRNNVVNNFSSTSTDLPLSANQGRILALNRNVMTAFLTTDFTVATANSYLKLGLNSSIGSGNLLTFTGNGIKIGAGISKVLVSANVQLVPKTTGRVNHIRIVRNSDTGKSVAWGHKNASYMSDTQITIAPVLVNVSEGDILTIMYYTAKNDVIHGHSTLPTTSLTVQAIS